MQVCCPQCIYYGTVNVAAQRRDANSLLNWMERAIRRRRECHEISWGDCTVLPTEPKDVLMLRYDWKKRRMLAVHNFSDEPRAVRVSIDAIGDTRLVDLLGVDDLHADGRYYVVNLPAYAYRWLRSGSLDGDLARGVAGTPPVRKRGHSPNGASRRTEAPIA